MCWKDRPLARRSSMTYSLSFFCFHSLPKASFYSSSLVSSTYYLRHPLTFLPSPWIESGHGLTLHKGSRVASVDTRRLLASRENFLWFRGPHSRFTHFDCRGLMQVRVVRDVSQPPIRGDLYALRRQDQVQGTSSKDSSARLM